MSEQHGPDASADLTHRIRPLLGRDPHERGRAATSLECLYDLVIVVAIGQAADQMAHMLAAGHITVALGCHDLSVVSVFVLGVYSLYGILYREISRFHLGLLAGTLLVLAAGPVLAAMGVPVTVCLLVVMAAPLVTIIGYELHGHRGVALALERVVQGK